MRSCLAYLFMTTCLSATISVGPAARADDEPKPFDEARNECVEWLKVGSRAKFFGEKKIDQKSVTRDFEDMEKLLGGKRAMQVLVEKFKVKTADAPRTAEDLKELLLAIWCAWRIDGHKGGLKGTLDALDKFVKVRFATTPTKATLSINGLDKGPTPKHVYLSREGKYDLKMVKDGYEPWEKPQYTPPERGESFEETLKKKP